MRALFLALLAEGATDGAFLPTLIYRAASELLQTESVEIHEVQFLNPLIAAMRKSGAERILEAAKQACNLDVLIVHSDLDAQNRKEALASRFEPGVRLVQAETENVCRTLIPMLPKRMIEAWILADLETLRRNLGLDKKEMDSVKRDLKLPNKPHQVEALLNPKQVLNALLREAQKYVARRPEDIEPNALYEPISNEIDLSRLRLVPSYKRFEDELRRALIKLRYLAHDQEKK